MASAYVPLPPEDDFLAFSTQQEDTLRSVGSDCNNIVLMHASSRLTLVQDYCLLEN